MKCQLAVIETSKDKPEGRQMSFGSSLPRWSRTVEQSSRLKWIRESTRICSQIGSCHCWTKQWTIEPMSCPQKEIVCNGARVLPFASWAPLNCTEVLYSVVVLYIRTCISPIKPQATWFAHWLITQFQKWKACRSLKRHWCQYTVLRTLLCRTAYCGIRTASSDKTCSFPAS